MSKVIVVTLLAHGLLALVLALHRRVHHLPNAGGAGRGGGEERFRLRVATRVRVPARAGAGYCYSDAMRCADQVSVAVDLLETLLLILDAARHGLRTPRGE